MLWNNLKSYGQHSQSMFKNKQSNKINKAKQIQNQKQHKQKQIKKHMWTEIIEHKNTTYVDVHLDPGIGLACTFYGAKRVA